MQRYPDGTAEGMVAGAFRFLQFDFGGGIHYLRFNDTSAVADNFVWTGAGVYRAGGTARIAIVGASAITLTGLTTPPEDQVRERATWTPG